MSVAAIVKYGHFIDGAFVAPSGGAYFDSIDPATGQATSSYARGNASDVDNAVQAAKKGLKAWRAFTPYERARCLLRIAGLLRDNTERIALSETLESGHPISRTRKDVENSARYFDYYAGIADKILGEVIPTTDAHLTYTSREPYGVTAQITPWNAPLHQLARGVAPSLAAGNSIIAKPAEQTSGSALILAELACRAGLPAGALNIVTGFGHEVGLPLVDHPAVRQITFTGSVDTGRLILTRAAQRVVPVTTELGGKSPFIVFADADLDAAVKAVVPALLTLSGQTCSAGTRLLVERSVLPDFLERMVALIKNSITIGPGMDDRVMGPLVSQKQMERVLSLIETGLQEGARLVHGGKRLTEGALACGYFVEPTIFSDVDNSMRIAREEIFGPVGVVIPFDTAAQAADIANDSDFGLVAAIWSRDFPKAHRLAAQLECGQVFINNYRGVGMEAPFGGYKLSGHGREKGLEAMRYYMQVKTIIVNVSGPA